MGHRQPGAMCTTEFGEDWLDSGTNAVCRHEPPTTVHGAAAFTPNQDQVYYSPAFKSTVDVVFDVAAPMTWDAFQRALYEAANEALQRQAKLMVERGVMTASEARQFVDARNSLVLKMRGRLTPFGELYSEILKPRSSLKTLDTLLAEKGSLQAVLSGVGKTRAVVNRLAVVARVAGPAIILLEVGMTAIVIANAPEAARGRVAAQQIGGASVGIVGGLAGGWVGCVTFGAWASPLLVVPVVGEVATGGACAVGGVLGALGVGYMGRQVGEAAGDRIYDLSTSVSEFTWDR